MTVFNLLVTLLTTRLRPVLLCCALLPAMFAQAVDMPVPTAVVDTTSGPAQGLVVNDIHTFKGIRYGKAPVGELRFLPPQAPGEPQG